jgi:hypothetical protein
MHTLSHKHQCERFLGHTVHHYCGDHVSLTHPATGNEKASVASTPISTSLSSSAGAPFCADISQLACQAKPQARLGPRCNSSGLPDNIVKCVRLWRWWKHRSASVCERDTSGDLYSDRYWRYSTGGHTFNKLDPDGELEAPVDRRQIRRRPSFLRALLFWYSEDPLPNHRDHLAQGQEKYTVV